MIPARAIDGPLFDRVDHEQLAALRAERNKLARPDARWRLRPRSERGLACKARLHQLTREILEWEHAMQALPETDR